MKLRVRKVTNVVGREATCDLYIENKQVLAASLPDPGHRARSAGQGPGVDQRHLRQRQSRWATATSTTATGSGLGTYVMTLHRDPG
ncbi:MAG: hypothetical protein WDO13_04560 [Verrucomicrobiota bacterium]